MELLLTEEEQMLKKTVRDFAERELVPKAARWDEAEEFPWENIKGLASLGLMGLTIGPESGGSGGTYRQLAIVIEELARCCPATSLVYLAHLSLGTSTLYRFGNDEQQRRIVSPLAKGEGLAAWALTEPGSGSDAASLQTTAVRKGNRYVLNGSKIFITNADVAKTIVVFATTDRALRSKGVLALAVERASPGLETSKQHGKMGMRGSSTAELVLTDCAAPVENRLGDEGDGFKIAMQVLDSSRISIAAQGVGIAQGALETALKYAQQRQTFGKPIAQNQAIQWMLADMAVSIDAARLLAYRAAMLKDKGLPHGYESAMAKLFASEAAMQCADRAVQIHGGYGYFKPSAAERLFRDARVIQIYEGTSEIQRLVIARRLLSSSQA